MTKPRNTRTDAAHEPPPNILDRSPPHSMEAEKGVLGSLLLNPMLADDVALVVRANDFYSPACRKLFEHMLEIHNKGKTIDTTLLIGALRKAGDYDIVGGAAFLNELAMEVPTAANAVHYARIVADNAMTRGVILAATEMLQDAYDNNLDARELLAKSESQLFGVLERIGAGNEAATMMDVMQGVLERIHDRASNGGNRGVPTGLFDVDQQISGMHDGELIILAARPGMGKAQPLDAKILTPTSWTTMGALRVGDKLASHDGQPSEVVGVFPQGVKQIYRVKFSDGRETECCKEHLWRVYNRKWTDPKILSTSQVAELLKQPQYKNRLWCDDFSGNFGGGDDRLPIDPWVLGFLLGDGDFCGPTPRFSTIDTEMRDRVAECVGPSHAVGVLDELSYSIVRAEGRSKAGIQGGVSNGVTRALQSLGLWGRESHTKFIPKEYRVASRDARLRLLNGLLDSDGWVEKFHAIRTATSSPRLATHIVELVRSLGGTASCREKKTRYTYRGEVKSGRPSYVINIQHPNPETLVTRRHRAERIPGRTSRRTRLSFSSIEMAGAADAQCIKVSHPSSQYITDDFIVTHNTALATTIAEHVCCVRNESVLFVSLEMTRLELAERMLCALARVNSHNVRNNTLTHPERRKLVEFSSELSQAPLLIDDSPTRTVTEIAATARRLKRRAAKPLRLIVIDYLQLIEPDNQKDQRQEQVAKIARRLKGLARELKVPILCLSQLNRQAEASRDNRPKLSHLRESGAIEQDADVVLFIHREEYYCTNEADRDKLHGKADVIVAKQRNGPIGDVPVIWVKEFTRFESTSNEHQTEFT